MVMARYSWRQGFDFLQVIPGSLTLFGSPRIIPVVETSPSGTSFATACSQLHDVSGLRFVESAGTENQSSHIETFQVQICRMCLEGRIDLHRTDEGLRDFIVIDRVQRPAPD
jgi:hypothetical protein